MKIFITVADEPIVKWSLWDFKERTEKSLGAIVKGGSKPIQGVLDYGEKPEGKGLYIMVSPGREIEFLTGPVAGGAQIMIFTTGRGAPQGYPIALVIKVCGNRGPRKSSRST